jgi:hypothetical protein
MSPMIGMYKVCKWWWWREEGSNCRCLQKIAFGEKTKRPDNTLAARFSAD